MFNKIKFRAGIILFVLFSILIIAFAQGSQQNPSQAKGVDPKKYAPDQIIVKFKSHVTPDDVTLGRLSEVEKRNAKFGVSEVKQLFQKSWRNDELDELKESHGLTRIHTLKVPKGTDIEQMVAEYNQDPDVEYAEPDYIVEAAVLPNDTYFNSSQWNLHNTGQTGGTVDADIDAPEAWDITTGNSSAIIAILDTGVQLSHPDLTSKILAGYDFVNSDSDPSDDNGHGTFVAGIAAATTLNSTGIAGVCWYCSIMPVKVIGADGTGTSSTVANGIIYAVDNSADVINLSLIGGYSTTTYNAVLYAYNAGRVVVAGAGNYGTETVYYPAGHKESIAVGATDHNDARASWSNYGYHIDVVAPGDNVISSYLTSTYAWWSGTSFATPHVAGLAGLILSRNPSYTPDQVRWHIEAGADDKGTTGWDKYYGWGRINAYRSLQTISPGLVFSMEDAYAGSLSKSVSPSSGTASTTFTYKVIYFDDNNWSPYYVQVCIDGNCYNMAQDTSASSILRDSNYANGEQYVYTTTLSSGTHNYYFMASNGTNADTLPSNGAFSGPSVTITDTTPPIGSVTINGGAEYTTSTSVILTLSCTDAGSSSECLGMYLSNDGSSWYYYLYAPTFSWTLSAGDGVKTVYVKFRDDAVNWSSIYSDTIILDTAPPTGSITINGGAASIGSTSATLTLSCTDSGSGCSEMRFSNDNSTWSAWEAYGTTKSWTLASGEGIKTIYAQFKDAVGNVSSTYSDTIILDTAPPTGSIVISGGAALTNSISVTLTLSCTDAGSGCSQMRFSSDNTTWSAWEAYATTKAWTLTSGDGTKTVYVQFKDAAGNVSSTYSDTIILDTAPPTGSITINGGEAYTYSTSAVLTLSCIDLGSGCAEMSFSNDNSTWSAWEAYATSKAWTLISGDGTKTVYVQFKNAVGNVSATYSDTIILDTAPPTGSISKIVFSSDRDGNSEIYIMDTDGTNQTRLTNNSAADGSPVWSPDGSKIVFSSNRDGNNEIYVMNADGNNPVRLTNNSASDTEPSWSPDSTKIAFRTNRDGNDEIYVMNADGTNPINLTNHPDNYDGEPHWSPDGSKIVFSSWRSGDARVWVMNADGTNPTQLSPVSWSGSPRWSPDGSKISYSAWGYLYVMNANGTGSVSIMYNSSGISPVAGSWSPDGTKVVLFSNHSGNYEIYTMNVDGSNLVRLTNNSANDYSPYWFPVPTGSISISINSGASSTNSTSVTLTLSCSDSGSGCSQMRFSNDNTTWSAWEAYATTKAWTLTSGDGTKTVYVQFKDAVGNVSSTYSDTITLLDTAPPITTAFPAGGAYTSSQSVTLTCSDGTGSGCDKIYYTTDGSTPTTSSTVYSGPITISTTTTLKFFAVDLAGNTETVKTEIYTMTSGVDLVVSSISAPSNVATGTNISIPNTVRNQGTSASMTSYVKFYLSADATIDATDVYLAQRSVGSLAGGASSSATTSLKIPVTVAAGTYYIGAIADATNTNLESNEANNTASTMVTVTSGVDLLVSSFSAPSSIDTGVNVSISNTVTNSGVGASATSYVKFYLSTDNNIDASDTYLAQRSVSSLTGGASSSASTTIKLPVTLNSGTYYIGAIADATNTNLESNEGNNTASTMMTVTSGVDLTVSSLSAPSSISTGINVSISNTVQNLGVGATATSYVKFYLSTDANIDSSDTYLAQRSVSSLTGGASSSASTTIKLPVTLNSGTYYIGAIADETNTNVESNETNNKAVSGAVTVLSGVDLVISSFSAPSSIDTGVNVSISNTVTNSGVGASATSYLKFYLSTDANIDSSDTYLTQRSVSSLSGGSSSSANTTIKLPVTLSPGTYYIGAIADETNTNVESNEGNNTAVSGPITVSSGVDLTVSSLSAPLSALTGTAISVSNTVANNGVGASVSSYVKFYLSTDATIDPATDTYLNQRSVSSLAGGATSSATTNITIPVSTVPGTYYIGAITDATATNVESNEANNITSTTITITSGIDLIVSSLSAPSSAVTGSSVSVANTVKNNGTGTSTTSYLKFYLSTDANIDSSDTYLTQRSISSLAGGASSSATTTITLSATTVPGTYYIGAIADATATNVESNEANNITSTTITITSGIDLIVSSLSAPSSAVTGSSVSVANTVKNNGTGTSTTSYLKFYLSTDANIDSSDTYLTQRSISSLAGGASSSATTTITLSVTLVPGTYYIGAIADETNTNIESDETNNKAVSGAITVLSGVDLVISSFSAPSSIDTGVNVSISNTVTNNGVGASATSYLKIYLSTDANIDSSDTYLTQRSVSSLSGGASSSASTTIKLPVTLSPGTYYIGAIADATETNVESNEGNNASVSGSITVLSGVDLLVSSFSAPSVIDTGGNATISNTVTNNGVGASATSYLKFYLSTDANIDSSDTYLTQRSVGSLNGGVSSSASTTVKLPVTLSPGTYYIGAIADATETNVESNEGNNTAATSVIEVRSGVDLVVSGLTAPGSATAGTSISVDNTVSNLGSGASASSYIKFYLSRDSIIDTSDTYLGQRSVSSISGGASSSATTNLTIPSTAAGAYWIWAIADATNTNLESDETNNTAGRSICIGSEICAVE